MNPENKNPHGGSRLEKPARQPRGKKPKRPKPQRTRRQKILHILFIVATVIAAIIVVCYAAFRLLTAPPEIVPDPVYTSYIDEDGNKITVEIPGLSRDRKEQCYTFLIVGQDTGGGGNTDVMMLASYDVPNQKLTVMSLPRDTYVPFGDEIVQLNWVYNWAGGGDDGLNALKTEVGELTGIYPDFHVVIQWDAVGELVDAIGGVYFDVPRNMNYDDPSQDLHIHLSKGYQLLDGEAAMGVVRYRHDNDSHYGYADGDLGRIKTQQAFLTAVVEKCLQPDVLLPNLINYVTIFQNNVQTDLTIPNMAYFGKSAIEGLKMDQVEFVTLPNQSAGDGHLLPIGEDIVELVNESLNPYKEDISLSDLDLATRGRYSSGGSSSNQGSSSGNGNSSRPSREPTASTRPQISDDPADERPVSSETPVSELPSSELPVSERPTESHTPSASEEPSASATPAPTQSQEPAETAQPTTPPATQPPATPPAAATQDPNEVVLPPEAENAAA